MKFSEPQLWRAFQFVAGELSESEQEAFEADLRFDETLCAAVAEATKLSLVLAQSKSVAVPSDQLAVSPSLATHRAPAATSHSRGQFTLAVVAIACCWLLMLVAQRSDSVDGEPILVGAVEEAPETEMIVTAWADSGESPDEITESETLERELDVPDWMLAAVELSVIEDSGSEKPDQG